MFCGVMKDVNQEISIYDAFGWCITVGMTTWLFSCGTDFLLDGVLWLERGRKGWRWWKRGGCVKLRGGEWWWCVGRENWWRHVHQKLPGKGLTRVGFPGDYFSRLPSHYLNLFADTSCPLLPKNTKDRNPRETQSIGTKKLTYTYEPIKKKQ